MNRILTLVLAGALVLVIGVAFYPKEAGPTSAAPDREVIPGRYIVTLEPGVEAASFAADRGKKLGFRADAVYTRALSGFAGHLPAAAVEALAGDSRVVSIEPDRLVHAHPQSLPTGINRMDVETNATAGIAGNGGDLDIDVAVLDTGVDVDHAELNVVGGARYSGSGWAIFWTCDNGGGSFDDDNGHGTHVAGTVAAKDNTAGVVGVAPGARIHAVKVLNSQGTSAMSCIILGVDWVTANAKVIEVANMSLGGGNSAALCSAIQNSTDAGVVYAVAAGNERTDAGGRSPANCSSVITVSAYADFDGQPGSLNDQTIAFSRCTEDDDDSFACFSNYGSVVEVAAPGVQILSTVPGGGYGYGSGTSMASPHVAGAVALYKVANPGYSVSHGPSVIADMAADGWTRPQDGACGFTGDPDGFAEPVIYAGTGCTDGPPPATATPTPSPAPATATPSPTPVPPSATATPVPTNSPAPGSMHVSDLDGSSVNQGSTWTASVLVTVRDANGAAVSNATVTGFWSGGSPSSANCVTDASGQCAVASGAVRKKESSNTFTVTSVSHSSLAYIAADNSDPDGDSDGTSIAVAKP